MKGQAAFTLIELLVVIAILSMLAAILFPVFAGAREKGRQTACLSNLRQLGLAVNQYTQDFDETLPGATDGNPGSGTVGGWVYYTTFTGGMDVTRGSIYPYVRNPRVYICASDTAGDENGVSYGINSCLSREPYIDNVLAGRELAGFDNPASWMLLGEESAGTVFTPDPRPWTGTTNDGYLNRETDSFSERHQGGLTLVYLDGHARRLRAETAWEQRVFTGGRDACE